MHSHQVTLQTHALDFWLARGAVALIAGLQLLFVNDNLSFGPRWLAPAFELALLVPLSVATVWTQGKVHHANADHHWHAICQHRKAIRRFALLLTAIVTALNFYALLSVTRGLLGGVKGGQSLLLDALNIWFTNIVVFALWFWNLDRGGPARAGLGDDQRPDFLFPQMLGSGDEDPAWRPGFIDYFYVSFTNATAFSPTDTMPLSPQSKLLMAVEATVSLLTVGLVAARAVNILT
ncbi:MAG: hypothetical protein K2Y02_06835 [Burkholderiaceae bacterium]|nr:hypothetical protein [Burkholderiaceae bacterium]